MKVEPVSPGPWVSEHLRAIPLDVYPQAERDDDLKRGVVFSINDRAAVAVLRYEAGILWCKALAGSVGGVVALQYFTGFIERMAQAMQARGIAMDTARPVIADVLRRAGYVAQASTNDARANKHFYKRV